ncbi:MULTISPECIES: hypothetical protein [unclassified Endozoicomonas]|uniref:hypothetical protein n=1 Tax=unclassified Endozoicomonas TaxID=2644528 RepID=UPI0021496E84|nr:MULTISPECIES: hypothetical protein [unclassified Endozoicomonas]
MHLRALVHSLPTHLNQSSSNDLSNRGQDNLFNENNRVNRPGYRVFSDTFTKLDSRSIAEFENLAFSPPGLEEPKVDLSDLLESYEVITEYPVIDLVVRGGAGPSAPRSVAIGQRLLMPEQIWKQKEVQRELEAQEKKRGLAGEPEVLAEQITEQKEPEEAPVIDTLTGMPVRELENKVWEFLFKVVDTLSPAAGKVKGVVTDVVSEEKVEQLKTGLKSVLKNQVDYEVNENIGRRILQIAQICGSTGPLLPALTLLGYSTPGYQFIPAMLALWRLKDFREEISALYYDHNATPALVDLTISWVPTLAFSLSGF